MRRVLREQPVVGLDQVGRAGRTEHPEADLVLVHTQVQDQIVELARHRERPEIHAQRLHAGGGGRRRRLRCRHGDLGQAAAAIDLTRHPAVGDPIPLERARQRRECDAARVGRPITASRQLGRQLTHALVQSRARHDLVDQVPLHRPLALDAFLERREVVGAVAADLALVRQPRQTAGTRQHGQQRNLGQRHGGVAVVGHHDPLAGQRQLVAAAGARPGHRGHPHLVGFPGGLFHRIASLVGELAEVHFPAVRGLTQHADVRAGAENALLSRGQHHRPDLGMLEAQPLDGVV